MYNCTCFGYANVNVQVNLYDCQMLLCMLVFGIDIL